MSRMVKVAEVVLKLPQSSVAVKVTVADPAPPHEVVIEVKLLDQVTPLQTSVADAPPCEFNHAFNCAVLPEPSHSTVLFEAAGKMTGAIVSTMVNVALVLTVLPQASIAVNITGVTPVLPQRLVVEV